jgi:hypothetical protein
MINVLLIALQLYDHILALKGLKTHRAIVDSDLVHEVLENFLLLG